MANTKLKEIPHVFGRILLRLLTVTYLGVYQFHTLEPIQKIRDHQGETMNGKLIKALLDFRTTKQEELSFVAKAAALSGAAVIGIFSWPATENTIWAAKMLWNWSFFMSTLALVGAAPTRLLLHLPDKSDTEYNEHKIKMALNLFLQPPTKIAGSGGGGKMEHRGISRRMLWVWQCPAMLMSYSWLFFLVGYALHVLTPVFPPSHAQVSARMAVVTICGAALLVVNFVFCAGMCQYRLQKGTLREWIISIFSGNRNTKFETKDWS